MNIFANSKVSALWRPLFIWLCSLCYSLPWYHICTLWRKRTGFCWTKFRKNYPLEDGFAAMITVLVLATGTLAMNTVLLEFVSDYVDSVDQRIYRLQNELNKKACADSAVLLKLKAPYATGHFYFAEFGCAVDL